MKFSVNGCNYTARTSTFPGGEEYINIGTNLPQEPVVVQVEADIKSSTNVMQLLMLTEALREYAPRAEFRLHMPYLPYARQDNRFAKGEALSIKVFCNLINDLKYDLVIVADCHSTVGLALLDNVKHITQLQSIQANATLHNMAAEADVIVAPDAGASKKAQEIATFFNKPLVQCLKTRTSNGDIHVQVLGSVEGKSALVVDDICDGGGTFLALAQSKLGTASKLSLYVTHGIFSKGVDVLKKDYDEVACRYEW